MMNWSKFWKEENTAFLQVMQISTLVFAKRFDRLFKINKTHKILDYGCGPGFLVDHLASKGASISGVDINPFFLMKCRIRFKNFQFVEVSSNREEVSATLQSEFKDQQFDFIVILSIAQYLESERELEDIVRTLASYLAPNGKIIVADVICKKNSRLLDGLALLWHCLLSAKIVELIKFMRYLFYSNYRIVAKDVKLMEYSEDTMNRIATRCSLNCSTVKHLTIHPTRLSYILSKKDNAQRL